MGRDQYFLLGGGVLLVTSLQWQAMSCSSLTSFQPGSREYQGSINVFGVNVHRQRVCLPLGVRALSVWVSLFACVCLPVGPGLGDPTMTANYRCEVWSKNQPRKLQEMCSRRGAGTAPHQSSCRRLILSRHQQPLPLCWHTLAPPRCARLLRLCSLEP